MGGSQLHKDVWIKLSKKSKELHPKDPRWHNASDEEEGVEMVREAGRGQIGKSENVTRTARITGGLAKTQS